MNTLPVDMPRVFGIETEYGIHPVPKVINSTELRNAMPPYLHTTLDDGFNEFGRVYIDHGNNVEVSGPEVTSRKGLLTSHFAGEELAAYIVARMYGSRRQAYKRSLDSIGKSRAEHENFLVGSGFSEKDRMLLVAHLATRIAVTGPGMILLGEDETIPPRFCIDQRGLRTSGLAIRPGSVDNHKPFMKSMVESFDLSEQTQRLEVVCGSHNMFAYPIAARVFNTSSVLRLIEQRKYPEYLQFENPAQAIHSIANDPSLTVASPLINGKRYTGLQIQYNLMNRVLKLDLPGDERHMAELTGQIVADLMDERSDPWIWHVEWLAKKTLLEERARKRGEDFPNIDSAMMDIHWHKLEPSSPNPKGLVYKLRKAGKVAMMPEKAAVEAAKRMPPDPTRARLRSLAIKKAALRGETIDVDWNEWEEDYGATKVFVDSAYGDGMQRNAMH